MRRIAVCAIAAAALLTASLATGCTGTRPLSPSAPSAVPPPDSSTGPATGSPTPTTTPTSTALAAPVRPTGTPVDVVIGLHAPWSLVTLPSGSTLIDDRDSGQVIELRADRSRRVVGTVPGVVHEGEGGLLGLAVPPGAHPPWLYAYLTTANDNRVVRMALTGAPGSYRLGTPHPLITGIPKASFHNGGRIAFGPDGMLYVTAGDASNGDNAQNRASLGGKILRVTPTGGIPSGNPFPNSPVWSLGHRNPQGIAWDSTGRMWASEFGQDTWDELNIITPGSNYGWPIVEGIGHDSRFVDPVLQWRTSEASPSGIAIVGGTIFMAGLGGERLWIIDMPHGGTAATARAIYVGTYGRLRGVFPAADGHIWILTNNTDGRGTPKHGDDRILSVGVGP